MMTHKFSNQKPLVYGLIGFVTGEIAALLQMNRKWRKSSCSKPL
jgi:hypothetical protein